MKKARRQAPREIHSAATGERRLVTLDQAPLRKEAVGSARAAMREIARLNDTIKEFERTIEPTFTRWERDNLGNLLSRESDLRKRIDELESLMEFATMESILTGAEPYDILKKAQQEQQESRENPTPDPGPSEEDSAREEEARKRDAAFGEEERDFRAHLRSVFGYDPDVMPKRDYKRMFGEYKSWRAKFESATGAATRSAKKAIPQRVKELYRHLVRRLHPDSGATSDPFLDSLWHDLQEAYKSRDLERMEILLAITEVNTGGDPVQSSLFHIRLVSKKMGLTLDGLKKRIAGIRKSAAWKFWHAKDRRQAELKLRKEAEERIEDAEMDLAHIEAEIAYWKSMARPKPSAPGVKPKAKKSSAASAIQKKSTRGKKSAPMATQTSFNF